MPSRVCPTLDLVVFSVFVFAQELLATILEMTVLGSAVKTLSLPPRKRLSSTGLCGLSKLLGNEKIEWDSEENEEPDDKIRPSNMNKICIEAETAQVSGGPGPGLGTVPGDWQSQVDLARDWHGGHGPEPAATVTVHLQLELEHELQVEIQVV